MCEKVSAILEKKGGPRREEAQKAHLPSPPSRKRKLPPLPFQARDPRPGGERPQSHRCLASRAGCCPAPGEGWSPTSPPAAPEAAAWATWQPQVLRVRCHGDGPRGWWREGSLPRLCGYWRGKDWSLRPSRAVCLTAQVPGKPRWVLWGLLGQMDGGGARGDQILLWKG